MLGKQLARLQSFGQRMPMATMGAEDHVLLPQVSANTDSNSFLPDIGVAGAVDESALVRPGQAFFALPDKLHRAIEPQAGD